uniref:putative malate dehydrogenase 1B isoform X2 n=1 Tax=Pristiophorus japonicus TaxID=55135 RepID=UPI00398F2691
MAKFVIAGRANCPYYAKAEHVADYLAKNLPDFKVHKIVQPPDDWKSWLQKLCSANDWTHQHSPIVWRELVDRGGKGLLLGGFNDFMEYAQGYYGFTSDMMTELMIKTAKENLKANQNQLEEELSYKNLIKPISIWISGALNPACNNLIPTLLNGELFGEGKVVSLHLLDTESSPEKLYGIQMEIEDMAWPLLHKVTVQHTLRKAFMDAEVIIVLNDIVPGENRSIEDCYKEMASVYQDLAVKIDTFAKSSVRVLVAGEYILNMKTHFLMSNTFSIDHSNFVAVPTQLEGEVKAQLAKKMNVNTQDVKDVIVWGNIGRTTYIDLHRARVHRYESSIWGPPEFSRPVLEVLQDSKWVEAEFLEAVHSHRSTIQAAMKHRMGISLAAAIFNVLHCWYFDSPPGEIMSLGVISEGDFGIPADLVFSVPVRFCGGKYVIQSEIEISEETKNKLAYIAQELKLLDNIFHVCSSVEIAENCFENLDLELVIAPERLRTITHLTGYHRQCYMRFMLNPISIESRRSEKGKIRAMNPLQNQYRKQRRGVKPAPRFDCFVQ